jgi:putative ABC transport system ATP-binding protein
MRTLTVEGVDIAYGDGVPVLRGVTVTARPGEVLAVTGTSGTPADARRGTAEALEKLGLAGRADQLIEELSGGRQQRTAIARGLALHGDVLLADEITSELDAADRRRVVDLLRTGAQRGAAVILATHDPEAAAACDHELHPAEGDAALVR